MSKPGCRRFPVRQRGGAWRHAAPPCAPPCEPCPLPPPSGRRRDRAAGPDRPPDAHPHDAIGSVHRSAGAARHGAGGGPGAGCARMMPPRAAAVRPAAGVSLRRRGADRRSGHRGRLGPGGMPEIGGGHPALPAMRPGDQGASVPGHRRRPATRRARCRGAGRNRPEAPPRDRLATRVGETAIAPAPGPPRAATGRTVHQARSRQPGFRNPRRRRPRLPEVPETPLENP
jgi:hypothetical protein